MLERHDVVIVGGGPGGLALLPLLAGLYPYYRRSVPYELLYPAAAAQLARLAGSLYELDFAGLVERGLKPVDFFRSLHHPTSHFQGPEDSALRFEPGPGLDAILLSREPVGGVWNNVPDNLLALSPGHWMEFGYYPLWQFAAKSGRTIDPNRLIHRWDLIDYYRAIPDRFGVADRLRIGVEVERIYRADGEFRLEARDLATGAPRRYAAREVVFAAGQRAVLRPLGVSGDDLPFVSRLYRRPEDYPGERVAVVGGGRSSDWAATELYDARRTVHYLMRQGPEVHLRLIDDSCRDLPYYARLGEIIASRDPRFDRRYHTVVERIEPRGEGGLVVVRQGDRTESLPVDHVIAEIGGLPNYDVLELPGLRFEPLRDRYRFQCLQIVTHEHNYESVDVSGLYAGGYLARGIGPSLLGMHGTVYATAADILKRHGLVATTATPLFGRR